MVWKHQNYGHLRRTSATVSLIPLEIGNANVAISVAGQRNRVQVDVVQARLTWKKLGSDVRCVLCSSCPYYHVRP
jgi:hypothetical protein